MNKLSTYLSIALVITVLVSIYINVDNKVETESAVLEAKTKAYNQAVSDNDSIQNKYNIIISGLLDSISVLRNEIQQSDLLLSQIKNRRNEKINSINRLTTDELSRAITDNYKERIVD